jgi:hypothetical protein
MSVGVFLFNPVERANRVARAGERSEIDFRSKKFVERGHESIVHRKPGNSPDFSC